MKSRSTENERIEPPRTRRLYQGIYVRWAVVLGSAAGCSVGDKDAPTAVQVRESTLLGADATGNGPESDIAEDVVQDDEGEPEGIMVTPQFAPDEMAARLAEILAEDGVERWEDLSREALEVYEAAVAAAPRQTAEVIQEFLDERAVLQESFEQALAISGDIGVNEYQALKDSILAEPPSSDATSEFIPDPVTP